MSNELEIKTPGMPVNIADFPDGFEEGVDREDFVMPRAKIVQAISQEHTKDNVEIGKVINSRTKEELPDTFIPLFRFTFWIKFNPKNTKDPAFDSSYEPGQMVYRITDPNDPRLKTDAVWGPNNEPPSATKFISFLVIFEGRKMPIILSFARTSAKAGKKLYSLALDYAYENKEPMYARKYKLLSRKESSSGNEYFVYDISPAGKVEEERLMDLKSTHDQMVMKKKDIEVHDVAQEGTTWEE